MCEFSMPFKGTKVQGAFGAEKWSTFGALPLDPSLDPSLVKHPKEYPPHFVEGGYTWSIFDALRDAPPMGESPPLDPSLN